MPSTRLAVVGLALAATLPSAAWAGELAPVSETPAPAVVDLGLEHVARRSPDGTWDLGVGGNALLPMVDLSSRFRLGLRLTESGQVQRLFASTSMGLAEAGLLDALQWSGRVDRGATGRFAAAFTGALHLDGLGEGWGLTHAPWIELGLQTSGGPGTAGGPRLATSLVLAVMFDVRERASHARPGTGFRIRASAAVGNDPGCTWATPTLLLSGRCLTLALAVDF